jgi:hypothetical protein
MFVDYAYLVYHYIMSSWMCIIMLYFFSYVVIKGPNMHMYMHMLV